MSVHTKLSELGLTLPQAIMPAFNYATVVVRDNTAYVSGQLPKTGQSHELLHYGRVGAEVSLEQARDCAQLCALHALAVLTAGLDAGALERVAQVLMVTGYVASTPGFQDHPKVVDGASELFTTLFGERGRHARAAVGVAALPRNAPVEIAVIFAMSESSLGGA